MNYRKIYNSLIEKRRCEEIIPQTEIGDNHHFIPRSAGGTETVRLTIREHIFAHELLVMIYRTEEPDNTMLFNMLMSIERMCGGNSSQISRMDKVYHKSRIVENMILESRKLRQNKIRIHNDEGITKYWDKDKPIPEGWYRGIYKSEERNKARSELSKDRKWIHKDDNPDMFVKKDCLDAYLNDGWKLGRTNLPPGFRERASKRLKTNLKCRKSHIDYIWIHNETTNENKTILKTKPIPDGFVLGRYTEPPTDKIEKYEKMYKFYEDCGYNYEKTQKEFNIENLTLKKFLYNCRIYLKNVKTYKEIQTIKVNNLYDVYLKCGFNEVLNMGYNGDEHSFKALLRHYKLKYDSKEEKYDKLIRKMYDDYKTYGYDYLEQNYEIKIVDVYDQWRKRGLIFKTRAEERAEYVKKFYNIWKETGWENTFKLMGIENTRYNRLLWGDTFRRYNPEEKKELAKKSINENYELYSKMAEDFNRYGFDYIVEKYNYKYPIGVFYGYCNKHKIYHKNPIKVERHTHHTEETKEKLRQSILGRVWVTNGIELHQIKKEEIDKYLNNGYKLGTKYKL